MAASIYVPLNPSERQIRLLRIRGGEWDDELDCDLFIVPLKTNPVYEALSYVWTSQIKEVRIRVNGTPTYITLALYQALRRLRWHRHPSSPTFRGDTSDRVLWADALCINQDDNDEKEHQVSFMGQIYGQAALGLLWLGEEIDVPKQLAANKEQHDDIMKMIQSADDLMKRIDAMFPNLGSVGSTAASDPSLEPLPTDDGFVMPSSPPSHWSPSFSMEDQSEVALYELEGDYLYQTKIFLDLLAQGTHLDSIPHLRLEPEGQQTHKTTVRSAFHWLLSRPWWSRIWIVQESILPPKGELLFGPATIPWDLLLLAVRNFHVHRTTCCSHVPGINDMLSLAVDVVLPFETLRYYWHTGEDLATDRPDVPPDVARAVAFRPEALLWAFRSRFSSDQRDKIYGLLSLMGGPNAADSDALLPVGYKEVKPNRVFTKAVLRMIVDGRTLDILSQPGDNERNPELPSWVPDFSQSINFAGSLDRFVEQLQLYRASGESRTQVSSIEENILELEGIVLGEVKATSSSMMHLREKAQVEALSGWYTFVKSHFDNEDETAKNPGWKKDLWRTICGDTVLIPMSPNRSQRMPPLQRIPKPPDSAPVQRAFNEWCTSHGLNELRTPLGPTEGASSVDSGENQYGPASIGHTIEISTSRRKLFISDKGVLGLAPHRTGIGFLEKDQIFLFPGGKVPLILRPVGSRHIPGLGMKTGCYELVGDCYLHGFMDGEGLKDPNLKKKEVYLV